MGLFRWTLANRKLRETRDGDYSESCKLQYGGMGCVLCPDGTVIVEPYYNGYGIFDGKDVYELVVDWNLPYLLDILHAKNIHDGVYYDIAKALVARTPDKCPTIVQDYVNRGKAAKYMLTDWKRSLGVEIGCTNNKNLPYPIKITDTPNPRRKYKDLPPSRVCQ